MPPRCPRGGPYESGSRLQMQSNRFNAEALLAGLLEWVRIESPSYDAVAVARMLDLVEQECAELDASIERHPGQDGYAGALQITYGDPMTPGILVLGHVDTVHPVGTLDGPLPLRREEDRMYGPGILDMKSGLYLAIAALKELVRSERFPALPITFLVITDEEVGSPTTRALIEAVAAKQRYVLVPEPAREGKLVTGRHAFLRYRITVEGRPAHAGADNARGVSAIRAMAELIPRIERSSDLALGTTYSVGVVHGGTFVNVIPTQCEADVLCVAPSEEAIASVEAVMASFAGPCAAPFAAATVTVRKGAVRPLFTPSEGGLTLYDAAAKFAAELGETREHGQFGGGSDGNFTGALGLPTLDGLGPSGGGPHTHDEYININSLASSCYILAGLMESLE